jgi:deoxyribodipyrimidine photo-lyase
MCWVQAVPQIVERFALCSDDAPVTPLRQGLTFRAFAGLQITQSIPKVDAAFAIGFESSADPNSDETPTILERMGAPDVQIVWFKRDLRTRDHEPLVRAAEKGPIVPLYIAEPGLWAQPDVAPQHWDFIAQSLVDLRSSLTKHGAPLIVRIGDAVEVFRRLIAAMPNRIDRLWAYEETGNDWTFQRDKAVLAWARSAGIAVTEIPHDFVVRRLSSRDDWSAIAKERFAKPLLTLPSAIVAAVTADGSLLNPGPIPTPHDLGLGPVTQTQRHDGGETAARATLKSFLDERCVGYEKRLSSPLTAEDGCSRLSPHLTYGTISLREVIVRTRRAANETPSRRFSLKAFEERLHWRSHFIQKLEDQPNLENRSYIGAFDRIRLDPRTDELGAKRFAAWSTGHTGYPMVDACMRSLNATGWINFRMRAMLVSFASYDLWLDWRPTAHHLARAFIDYEPGIHYPQIQMQSGTTGINTIRIYDPVKQGLEHDPDGDFVRKWIPELASVGDGSIHQPWLLDGTFWGRPPDYAEPIVNHADAIAFAWKQIEVIKRNAQRSGASAAIQEKHGSRRPPPSKSSKSKVPSSRR